MQKCTITGAARVAVLALACSSAAAFGESIFLPGVASQQGFGAEDTHTVFSL